MDRLGIWRHVASSLIATAMISMCAGVTGGSPAGYIGALAGAWGVAIYAKAALTDAFAAYERRHVPVMPTGWRGYAHLMAKDLIPVFGSIGVFFAIAAAGMVLVYALAMLFSPLTGR